MRTIIVACGMSVLAAAPNAVVDTGAQPTLEVSSRTMKRGGGEAQSAWANARLVVGQPVTWLLDAGSSHPEERTLCGGGVTEVGPLDTLLGRRSFVWEIRAVPTRYENNRTTFDLEWARYEFDGRGKPAAQGKATLTLAEGAKQTIDFVRGEPGTANCAGESIVIEVGAGVEENPSLADGILQYDLWLTDASPAGRLVHHFGAMGRQGTPVGFGFLPLRFAVPDLVPDQLPYDVVTAVLGTLRGRLLQDGRIAVAVDTTRRDGLAARGASLTGFGAASGSKWLELGDGEAIEIEVPAPSGYSSRAARPGALPPVNRAEPRPKQPVAIKDGRVIVDEGLFFAGHRTSLLLQVKRVR
jgi:hypothetical protein